MEICVGRYFLRGTTKATPMPSHQVTHEIVPTSLTRKEMLLKSQILKNKIETTK